ncbi:MAG: hypothetical protein ACI4J8_08625 [Oscillospiraceae bacterium]
MIRLSKSTWLWGELLFVALSAFALLIALFVGSLLPVIGSISWSGEWSSFMTRLNSDFPKLYVKNILLCRDASYTVHGTPVFECIYSFIVMWLNLIIVGIIILLGSVSGKQTLFMIVAAAEILVGGGAIYFDGYMKWLFPLAHTQYGLHFNTIFSGSNFPISGSFIYLALLVAVELVACQIAIKKMNNF